MSSVLSSSCTVPLDAMHSLLFTHESLNTFTWFIWSRKLQPSLSSKHTQGYLSLIASTAPNAQHEPQVAWSRICAI